MYGERRLRDRAWATIDRELDIIEQLGFPGYFLVVWDLVEFCRRSDIFCQGRGSAANSAVCYALGITKADAVGDLDQRVVARRVDRVAVVPQLDEDAVATERAHHLLQFPPGR